MPTLSIRLRESLGQATFVQPATFDRFKMFGRLPIAAAMSGRPRSFRTSDLRPFTVDTPCQIFRVSAGIRLRVSRRPIASLSIPVQAIFWCTPFAPGPVAFAARPVI